MPAFPAFAAFSPDGRTFVWLAPRTSTNPSQKWRKQISVGEDDPKRLAFEGDYDKVATELTKDGWTTERRPPPSDLKLEAHLTSRPPRIVLEKNGSMVDVAIGKLPYSTSSVAEIWGMSADGKHVAVHVADRDQHFAFVARVP